MSLGFVCGRSGDGGDDDDGDDEEEMEMEKYEEAGIRRWRAASKLLSCGCDAFGRIIKPNQVGANSYENYHANSHMDTKHILTC